MASAVLQRDLFGDRPVDFSLVDVRRVVDVDGAWIDHAPSCLTGHSRLFDELVDTVRWRNERREMYERVVDVPRALALLPDDGPVPDVVEALARALGERYATRFDHTMCAHYRSANDSVAMHADKVRDPEDSLVAILSLGAPRRFLLRPNDGGVTRVFRLGMGDLLVMGGRAQALFTHGVPKCVRAEPRMSVMLRRRSDVRFVPNGARRSAERSEDRARVSSGKAPSSSGASGLMARE